MVAGSHKISSEGRPVPSASAGVIVVCFIVYTAIERR